MPSPYINRETPAASHLDINDKYEPSEWATFCALHRPDIDANMIEWLRHHKNMMMEAIERNHVRRQDKPRARATIEHFQARIDAAKAYK